MRFRNGIFILTEERYCPLYNVGEELVIAEGILTLPAAKPACMSLVSELIRLAAEDESYEQVRGGRQQKNKFDCGGCTGLIRFEFKKDKGFETLQMKLLAASERKERIRSMARFAGSLRDIKVFEPLKDDDLLDLATLLKVKEYPYGMPILQRGDPGTSLFILLGGKVEVLDEQGVVLAELGAGDIFGEMSLLSGGRVTTTIYAAEPSQLAVMDQKDFRHVLTRFPALQVFFYKLLVSRITAINLQRAEELASGMVGQIADIPVAELCQMINGNQRSGVLTIDDEGSRATLAFNEGELVFARVDELDGEEAFFRVLTKKSGRFKFSQDLPVKYKKNSVIGGFMGLIMEGMRRLDMAAEG
ncbi:MAG: DUF4388 domain-containing protein [Desulfopila sp.]